MELKTLIIKVCKKKVPPKEDEKCFTKLTSQDNIELSTFPPDTSSGESSNKEHGASAIKSNENTTNYGYIAEKTNKVQHLRHVMKNTKAELLKQAQIPIGLQHPGTVTTQKKTISMRAVKKAA